MQKQGSRLVLLLHLRCLRLRSKLQRDLAAHAPTLHCMPQAQSLSQESGLHPLSPIDCFILYYIPRRERMLWLMMMIFIQMCVLMMMFITTSASGLSRVIRSQETENRGIFARVN